MSLSSSLFLGILQGLAEFLPISSSGHLVIAQSLIPGFSQPGVLFDVVLHTGTLLAIVIYFRREILALSRNYIFALVVGTIPAAILGFAFQAGFEQLFGSTRVVGLALLITAIMNYGTDRVKATGKNISYLSAFIIGIAQALAIIPGISRSGATIFAGTGRKINRKKAAEFSFLLSVPAVFGASCLQFFTYGGDQGIAINLYIAGFLASFISGLLAINWVIRLLVGKKFKAFAVYCVILGSLTLLAL